VPIPADSPVFDAFRKLGEQQVYHQRMTITANDPRMAEMMAQMGFGPAETITTSDAKQVSMHLMMPIAGKTEDMELRGVLRNGRMAKKWISPGSARYLKEGGCVDRETACGRGSAVCLLDRQEPGQRTHGVGSGGNGYRVGGGNGRVGDESQKDGARFLRVDLHGF
jgi:hypothetical protein